MLEMKLAFFCLTGLIFLLVSLIATLAQAIIIPSQLIEILVPVIVWLASGLVNWLKTKLGVEGFGGTILVTLVVPVLSLAASYIATLIKPELSFLPMFLFGLLAVFVNELIKQWQQTLKGTQTKADKNLIG